MSSSLGPSPTLRRWHLRSWCLCCSRRCHWKPSLPQVPVTFCWVEDSVSLLVTDVAALGFAIVLEGTILTEVVPTPVQRHRCHSTSPDTVAVSRCQNITDYWSPGDAKVSCMQSFLCSTVPMKGVSALLRWCGAMAQSHQWALPDTRYLARQPAAWERAGSVWCPGCPQPAPHPWQALGFPMLLFLCSGNAACRSVSRRNEGTKTKSQG